MVEVAGIEPASESISIQATTCLAPVLLDSCAYLVWHLWAWVVGSLSKANLAELSCDVKCDLFPFSKRKQYATSTVKPRNQPQISCIPHKTLLATISLPQSIIVLIYFNKVLYISFNRLAALFSRDLTCISNSSTLQMSSFHNTHGVFNLMEMSVKLMGDCGE